MSMYKVIEVSDAYSKTPGSFWQYYRDEPALDNNGNIIDSPANNNNSASLKLKQEILGQVENSGIKDIEIMVPLKYLSNFWRTIEMPLINCKISLQLECSSNCILVGGTVVNQNVTL